MHVYIECEGNKTYEGLIEFVGRVKVNKRHR